MDFSTYQKLIEQYKNHQEDSLFARFYDKAVKTGKTDANGLPVFKTVCYCEIRIKDNTTEVFDQPASPDKIARFPVEYARYQLSKKQAEKGLPLEQIAFLTPAEIEACKYRGVFTLEALADLSDVHAAELGLEAECAMAKRFRSVNRELKQTENRAQLEQKYQARIRALEAEITNLKRVKEKHR